MAEATDIDNQVLDELFEKYRKSPDSYVFVLLADACRKIERIDEALEICRQGIDRHPSYASGYVVKGKCHYDLGDRGTARETFEHVLSLDENNLVALKYLGMIEAEQGRYDSARDYFQHILQLDPDNKVIKETMRAVEEQKQMSKGETSPSSEASGQSTGKSPVSDALDAADGLETSDELATLTLADIFASQGYRDKALKICEELLKKNPRNRVVREKLKGLGGKFEDEGAEAAPGVAHVGEPVEPLATPAGVADDPSAIDLDAGTDDTGEPERGDMPKTPGAIELGFGADDSAMREGSGGAVRDGYDRSAADAVDEIDGRDTVELTGPVDERGAIQLPHRADGMDAGEAPVSATGDVVGAARTRDTAASGAREEAGEPPGPQDDDETGADTPVGFDEIDPKAAGAAERDVASLPSTRTTQKRKDPPPPVPAPESRRSIDEKESLSHFRRWLRQIDD